MTALRQRLIEEMQLRGFAERSIGSYVHAVHRLAQHYHRAPDSLSDDEIRSYLVQLRAEEKLAPASINLTLSALKFF
ncbi:MAG: site-specific integrase [Gemmatimonadaceae bacterium]